jgi:hypothetical protein
VISLCNFRKTAQEKNHPIGENSPNLVTLVVRSDPASFLFLKVERPGHLKVVHVLDVGRDVLVGSVDQGLEWNF